MTALARRIGWFITLLYCQGALAQQQPSPVEPGLSTPATEPAQDADPSQGVEEPTVQSSADAEDALAAINAESKPKRQFALFRTAALDPTLQELAPALDPVVLSELNAIGSIEVRARPSLDLPAMQLAIDCVGEIAECMALVAREAGVEALVAPILRSDGDLVLVTLLYYDSRENEIKGVTRQLSGRSVAQAMLDAVPEMVREAFGLPPEPIDEPTPEPIAPPPTERSLASRVVPWTLAGVGAATLIVGIGLGVASNNAEDEWSKADPQTRGQVHNANDHYDDAKQRALAANVCFGVGGAALVASFATWLFMREEPKETRAPAPPAGASARKQKDESAPASARPHKVSFLPLVSRFHVGLGVQGRFR